MIVCMKRMEPYEVLTYKDKNPCVLTFESLQIKLLTKLYVSPINWCMKFRWQ